MIAMLTGTVVKTNKNYVVLEVNGIGFQVFMTERDIVKISCERKVTIHTYTYIREDILQLYGFNDESSLRLFKFLLGVSGMGPKIALNILNSSSPENIRDAIMTENKEFLKTLPGIGQKSAAKLILELKDKLKDFQHTEDSLGSDSSDGHNSIVLDAVNALLALGYTNKEANEWVNRAIRNLNKPYDTGKIVSYVLKNMVASE